MTSMETEKKETRNLIEDSQNPEVAIENPEVTTNENDQEIPGKCAAKILGDFDLYFANV